MRKKIVFIQKHAGNDIDSFTLTKIVHESARFLVTLLQPAGKLEGI
jgi:hypothetical protein